MQILSTTTNINPVTTNDIEQQNEKTQHQKKQIYAFDFKRLTKTDPNNLCEIINKNKTILGVVLSGCLGISGSALCIYSEAMDNPHGEKSRKIAELGIILTLSGVAIALSVFIAMILEIFPSCNKSVNKLKSRIITVTQELNSVKNKNTDKPNNKLDSIKTDNLNIEKFSNEISQQVETKGKNYCVFV